MKVKPVINGIEVKVGQVWRDVGGCDCEITYITEGGCFTDEYDVYYNRHGEAVGGVSENNLVALIKGIDTIDSYSQLSDSSWSNFKQHIETTYGESTSPNLMWFPTRVQFTESEINAKINEVIKHFDWQRAASAYTALKWSWYSIGIPSVGELVVAGIERMKEAVEIAVDNQEEGYVSSGGLIGRAYIMDGELTVQLEMQVTEATSY